MAANSENLKSTGAIPKIRINKEAIKMAKRELRRCERLLLTFLSEEYENIATPFYKPIEEVPAAADETDLKNIAENKMCLSQMKYNLYMGIYKNGQDFAFDMRKIFELAAMFDSEHNIAVCGRQLQQVFEDYFHKTVLGNREPKRTTSPFAAVAQVSNPENESENPKRRVDFLESERVSTESKGMRDFVDDQRRRHRASRNKSKKNGNPSSVVKPVKTVPKDTVEFKIVALESVAAEMFETEHNVGLCNRKLQQIFEEFLYKTVLCKRDTKMSPSDAVEQVSKPENKSENKSEHKSENKSENPKKQVDFLESEKVSPESKNMRDFGDEQRRRRRRALKNNSKRFGDLSSVVNTVAMETIVEETVAEETVAEEAEEAAAGSAADQFYYFI